LRTEEKEHVVAENETGRLEAFSDGVIAVAITLLVLDIKVPHATDLGGGTLLRALSHQWPVYLAYLTSFATILVMWLNHHNLFKQIKRVDHTLLLLNGLLLLGVTLVPFPTALIGGVYPGTAGADGGGGLCRLIRADRTLLQYDVALCGARWPTLGARR